MGRAGLGGDRGQWFCDLPQLCQLLAGRSLPNHFSLSFISFCKMVGKGPPWPLCLGHGYKGKGSGLRAGALHALHVSSYEAHFAGEETEAHVFLRAFSLGKSISLRSSFHKWGH